MYYFKGMVENMANKIKKTLFDDIRYEITALKIKNGSHNGLSYVHKVKVN